VIDSKNSSQSARGFEAEPARRILDSHGGTIVILRRADKAGV
jgi:hypothetical protein